MKSQTKTVLITGSSSGIGRETAIFFQKKGWNVVATMRNPEKEKELMKLSNILCLPLDVTNQESIEKAIQEILGRFGSIDVLVNNAGYGLTGVFEEMSEEQIMRQFNTNVFGVMRMMKAVIPHMRKERTGTIINITSIAGHISFPFFSPYNSSKWAVEGFSESIQYELGLFGIRVKMVEPGPIKTDFYDRSADIKKAPEGSPYKHYADHVNENMHQRGHKGLLPIDVAKVIYRAATDGSTKLRYPVGLQVSLPLLFKRLLPHAVLRALIEKDMLKK